MQRICNKCHGVIEQLNKEWLGNLGVSCNVKHVPFLYWEEGRVVSATETQTWRRAWQVRIASDVSPWRAYWQWCSQKQRGEMSASLLSYPPVSIPCLPSAQHSQKPTRHWRLPEKCSNLSTTQFPWDTERTGERQRMAQIVVIKGLVPRTCCLIYG